MMDNIITEVWLPVIGHETTHHISNLGRVKGLSRIRGKIRLSRLRERIMKLNMSGTEGGSRYYFVNIDGKCHYVHHMVAAAFIGPRPIGYQVCHNDGNSLCNTPANLRYDTRAGNYADKVRHGTQGGGIRVLTIDKVKEIKRLLLEGVLSGNAIARLFDVTPPAISHIKTGTTWRHVEI